MFINLRISKNYEDMGIVECESYEELSKLVKEFKDNNKRNWLFIDLVNYLENNGVKFVRCEYTYNII